MKTKTTPNIVIADLIRMEGAYYKYCDKTGADTYEQAKHLGHFFKFLLGNAYKLTKIINTRNNGQTKSKTHNESTRRKS